MSEKAPSAPSAAPPEALLRRLADLEIRQLAQALGQSNQKRLWNFVDRVTRRLSDDDVMDVMVEEFLLELKADRVAYVVAEEDGDEWTFAVAHEAARRSVPRLPLPYMVSPDRSQDFQRFLTAALEREGPEVSAWSNPVKIQPEPHLEGELREEFQAALEEEFGLASFVSCRSAMACVVEAPDGGKALFCVQRLRDETPWTRFQRDLFREMCRYAASLLDQTLLSQQVRDLRDQLSSLIESMPSAIVGMDLLGTVAMWNSKARDIFGPGKEEALGKVFWKTFPDFAGVEDGIRRILALGPEASLDFPLQRFRRRDGKNLYLRASLFALFGSDRGELALRVDDVTGSEELRQKLSISQRRELQGALLEAAGHELQNVLTAMRGRLWLAESPGGNGAGAVPDLEALRAGVDQASGALSRMLALSGGESSEAELFDMRAAVQEAVALCRRTFGHSVNLLHRDAGGRAPVRARRQQAEQAMLNLLLHAQSVVRGEGYVAVRLEPSDPPPGFAPGGGWIRLQVESKGGGPDKPAADNSTSLGWTVARALVEHCGGAADEEGGEGLRIFRLWFPLAEAPETDEAEPAPDSGSGGNIVLVQPDAPLRETTLGLLRRLGYAAEGFPDGAGAIRHLESGCPCDLALVDWDLPVLNGRDTAAVLRALRPALPLLFLGAPAKSAGLPSGSALLPRSHRVRQLAAALRAALTGASPEPSIFPVPKNAI